MKKKQIIWLAVVLAVLGVVYGALFLSNKREAQKEQEEEASQVIQVTEMEDIRAFSYEAPEQEQLHFEKKDGGWVCTDDEEMELEQSYPDGVAESFGQLTASRKLEEIDALKDYGLEEPAYTVTLQPEDGEEVQLLIGNSTGEEYYLQVKGEEDVVYTISSTAVSTLDHSLADMEKVETEEETEETDQ